jgi:hypothetical protein
MAQFQQNLIVLMLILDALKKKSGAYIKELSAETIASITGWDYILSVLTTVAGFLQISIRNTLS